MGNRENRRGVLRRIGSGDAFHFWRAYTRDQRLFIIESMLLNSASLITGGVFLTGLLVLMGASNLMVGIVTSAGVWSMMLSLAASIIIERTRRRKKLMTLSLAVYRLFTTLPVFLPLVMGGGTHTALTAAVLIIIGNAVFSLFNTGFNIFLMDSVPMEGRVSFIYMRMLFLRIAYTVTSVAMGLLLDALNKSYIGFVIVFSLGLAIGVADVICFIMIIGKDGAQDSPPAVSGLTRRLLEPLLNKRYLRFLIYTLFYFIFYYAATSYTALYQIKYLNLSYAFLTIYNTCIYVLMIVGTRRWAAREERTGSLRVLVLTSLLLPLDLLVYSLLTPHTLWLVVFSVLFVGIGNSGYWTCLLPYRYSLMPEQGKAMYEGWYLFVFSAANLLGALMGGKLQTLLPTVSTWLLCFSNFQIIYLLAGVMTLLVTLIFWVRARRD